MTAMFKSAVVLAVVALIASLGASQGLSCDKPLTESDIKDLLSARVPDSRIRQFIASCGVSVSLPDGISVEERLRSLGASAAVIGSLSPPATSTAGNRWRSPIDHREMAFIPAGRFQMGSPASEAGRDADEAQFEFEIAHDLWIDVTEVPNAAFREFVVAHPEWEKGRLPPELHDGKYLDDWSGTTFPSSDAPVVWVNWYAARAYCTWAGKRLPTEAEWEFAARAGATTTYWWGDAFEAAHVASKGYLVIPDVRHANRLGLQDILGGVWEWTSSLYRPYPYAANDGREAVGANGPRVVRGGSWANGGQFLRAANRSTQQTSQASDLTGFRCVR